METLQKLLISGSSSPRTGSLRVRQVFHQLDRGGPAEHRAERWPRRALEGAEAEDALPRSRRRHLLVHLRVVQVLLPGPKRRQASTLFFAMSRTPAGFVGSPSPTPGRNPSSGMVDHAPGIRCSRCSIQAFLQLESHLRRASEREEDGSDALYTVAVLLPPCKINFLWDVQ